MGCCKVADMRPPAALKQIAGASESVSLEKLAEK
jgi:hypothetical protein